MPCDICDRSFQLITLYNISQLNEEFMVCSVAQPHSTPIYAYDFYSRNQTIVNSKPFMLGLTTTRLW